ncbi:hypothetical protein KH5H1_78460 [Corallococcus caeni]|nr:hypothetical protein KH5H1_78460 [Corallococcus sp. KH5-1]
MLDSGLPMGTVTAPAGTCFTSCHEANVVLSVGPYTWTSFPDIPAASAARIAPGSTASPPTWSWRTVWNVSADCATNWLNRAVVTNSVVMRSSRRYAANAAGDSATSFATPTSRPPCSSTPQISNVAASNDAFDTCAMRSSAVNWMKFVSTSSRTMAR